MHNSAKAPFHSQGYYITLNLSNQMKTSVAIRAMVCWRLLQLVLKAEDLLLHISQHQHHEF